MDNTGNADTTYVDTDVESGQRYVYRVKAWNASGLSARSGYFNARVPHPPEVTVSFEQAEYAVAEGESVKVAVVLDADPERKVTVPIATENRGGASDDDYSVPSEVVFDRGETRQTIAFTATDDAEDDDGESVLLEIGSGLQDRVSAGDVDEATCLHHRRRRGGARPHAHAGAGATG